jgi:virginiamycin B lyase
MAECAELFSFSTRAGVALAVLAAVAAPVAAPVAAMAQCTSNTPKPIVETWSPAKIKSNGAVITIYTGPTDRGAQLQITSGIGNSLWVASTSASSIMQFSTKGKATLYATPTANSLPEAITANGKSMVFTEWDTGCAGTVVKSGAVTEFSTGISPNKSTSMAAGPGKTAWFATDYNGIGRITSKNKVSLFPFPDESNQTTAITQGPDGNMWFIENGGPNFGIVTPKGKITEHSTGLGNAYSFGIATGSDGRVWFADNGDNSIAAINATDYTVTNYTTGFTGDPISIVAGPDGNLYFGETTPVVGRITPAGVVTEYPFTASEGTFPILSLAVGPDGNIWFANNSHSQVGVLHLPIK